MEVGREAGNRVESKAPKSKLQAPEKLQGPNLKKGPERVEKVQAEPSGLRQRACGVGFGAWAITRSTENSEESSGFSPEGILSIFPRDCFSLCSLRSLRLMKFQFRHADIPLLSVSSAFGYRSKVR